MLRKLVNNEKILAIASEAKKTTAQVLLRWAVQRGIRKYFNWLHCVAQTNLRSRAAQVNAREPNRGEHGRFRLVADAGADEHAGADGRQYALLLGQHRSALSVVVHTDVHAQQYAHFVLSVTSLRELHQLRRSRWPANLSLSGRCRIHNNTHSPHNARPLAKSRIAPSSMSVKSSTRIACASWDVHTGELRSFNEQFLEKVDLPYGRALGNPRPFLWSDLCGFSVYYAHPDTQSLVSQSTRHLAEVFNDMRLGRATRHFLSVTLVTPLGRVQVRG